MTRVTHRPERVVRVWLLVGGLLALALQVQSWVLLLPEGDVLSPLPLWWVFLVGFVAAETAVVHVQWGREAHTFGFGEVPFVMGLFVLPPTQLVFARVLGAGIAVAVFRRQALLKAVFNLAQTWLVTGVALLLFAAVSHGSSRDWLSWLMAVVVVLLADALATAAILAAMTLRGVPLSPSLAWTTLWTGAVPAVANTCFALIALDVLLLDWRGAWALVFLAGFVAIAQRGHVGLQRRHERLERLNAFSASLANHLEVAAVIDEVLAGAADLLEAETCELFLSESFGGKPVVFRRRNSGATSIEPHAGLPEETVERRRSRRPGDPGLESLTVAVTERGLVVGAICVRGRLGDVGGFGYDDLRLLRGVVSHAAAALVNGRLADQLREQVRENEHQVLHDALTGLPNRVLFDRHVSAALAAGDPVAVILLDLDRFKDVNDTLGHAAGDQLLCEAGLRISAAAPGADVVARLGGDEFALLLRGDSSEGAQRCADAIRQALRRPMAMHGLTLTVDASVGVTFAPDHGDDSQTLLRRADVAMYRAKSSRQGVAIYSAEQDDHASTRLSLVTELRDAIHGGQLELWYQPKAQLSTGAVRSVEALVRWRHPERGLIPPDAFIPVAEQTGLIDPLTEWVLDEAMRQCDEWRASGLALSVAVNVSTRSLRRDTFTAEVVAVLERHDVPPSLLVLEITESAMLEDPQLAGARLRELRRLGVRVSVDDFGTGYSSLSNLKHLPVDEVKIDRSFVQNLAQAPDDQAIVGAIVQLVHRLGLSVVAEGVETDEGWELLRALGCDLAQGYLLSKPLPAEAFTDWYDARPSLVVPAQQNRLPVAPGL